jgi:hypothetical protein
VLEHVRFSAGITFAKPNEFVHVWDQTRGWDDRGRYKKRLSKVSRVVRNRFRFVRTSYALQELALVWYRGNPTVRVALEIKHDDD